MKGDASTKLPKSGNCECSNHTEYWLYLAKTQFLGTPGYIEAAAMVAGNVGEASTARQVG